MAREIFSKEPQAFNLALAEKLQEIEQLKAPEWSFFVKTGVSKQRVPEDADFWQKRAASILRQLYINGVVGVERLRTRYGSRKNRGVRPARFKKSSGKIIRLILQQLEQAELVEKVKDTQFGRRLTKKGREYLDAIKTEEKPRIELSEYIGKEKELETQEELKAETTDGIEA